MNRRPPVKQLCTIISVLICSVNASAQWNKKAYSEWSEKEAQKVLVDSPWVKTVGFAGPVETSKYSSSTNTSLPPSPNRDPYDRRLPADPRLEGATRSGRHVQVAGVNCRVRFLSAKPMIEAFSRSGVTRDSGDNIAAQLKALTDADLTNHIVIAISCDSKEKSSFLNIVRLLLTSRPPSLAPGGEFTDTFLETTGGKRVVPQKYEPPRDDRLGALLIFPRFVDGTPFNTPGSDELRFYRKASKEFTINVRFKLQDMSFGGKLEY